MGLFQENHDEGEDGHLNEGVQHAGDGQGRQSAFPQYNHQRASDPGEADAVVRLSVVIEVTAKKLQSPRCDERQKGDRENRHPPIVEKHQRRQQHAGEHAAHRRAGLLDRENQRLPPRRRVAGQDARTRRILRALADPDQHGGDQGGGPSLDGAADPQTEHGAEQRPLAGANDPEAGQKAAGGEAGDHRDDIESGGVDPDHRRLDAKIGGRLHGDDRTGETAHGAERLNRDHRRKRDACLGLPQFLHARFPAAGPITSGRVGFT